MSKKILVVDDLASQRKAVQYTLSGAGYEVLQAANGQEAMDRLKAQPSSVNLVLSDLKMPVMDGLALLDAIKQDTLLKNTPVIMLLMESQLTRKEDLRQAGAAGWILKPFQPEQLCTMVKKVIA